MVPYVRAPYHRVRLSSSSEGLVVHDWVDVLASLAVLRGP